MAEISVKAVFELKIEASLTRSEAEELLFFLKTACTPPRAPSAVPHTDIVRRLAIAIEGGLK